MNREEANRLPAPRSRIPSRWIGSSAGRAASIHVLVGSAGAWGEVRQGDALDSQPARSNYL
jgi:hypothetical protein